MTSLVGLTRLLAATGVGAATLMLAGCPGPSTNPQSSATSATPTANSTTVVATGAPAGPGGDPCALITPTDIKAIVGASVTKITRQPASTDADGASQQCVFAITGAPPTGPAATLLAQMAAAFGGGAGSGTLDSAGIGVILFSASGSGSPEPVDTTDLPPGAKLVPGLGDFAVVVPSPLNVGGAAICAVGSRSMAVIAIQNQATSAATLEALLRAGVARL